MNHPTQQSTTMNGPHRDDPVAGFPAISDRSGVTDAVRVQILATEHWNLLATRSMIWNEIFNRASMFVTLLSAAVVALALVAQATGFGMRFRMFALMVLPVVLLMGLATFIRLGEANGEDFGLVAGMNRLRNAYLELAPELQPYFITGHHDDIASIMQSFGMSHQPLANLHLSHRKVGIPGAESRSRSTPSILHILEGTPSIVAAINVVVFGVISALVAESFGAPEMANVAVGVMAALIAAAGHALLVLRGITRLRREYNPRFPSE